MNNKIEIPVKIINQIIQAEPFAGLLRKTSSYEVAKWNDVKMNEICPRCLCGQARNSVIRGRLRYHDRNAQIYFSDDVSAEWDVTSRDTRDVVCDIKCPTIATKQHALVTHINHIEYTNGS